MLSASITNAVSDAAYALFLLWYSISGMASYLKNKSTTSLFTMFFFLTLFILATLGAFAHYYSISNFLSPVWIDISLLAIFLSYLLINIIKLSDLQRIIIMFLVTTGSFLYLTQGGNFLYPAWRKTSYFRPRI